MLSKSLSRLIDEAIIPAILLVAGKLASVLVIAALSKSQFNFTLGRYFFALPSISFSSFENYLFANSYSNLFTFAILVTGCTFVLLRAHFFHSSHISPQLHAKLEKMRLGSLVSDTFTIYHQAFIWFAFVWLFTVFLLVQAFLQFIYPWIAIVATLISLNMSWFLIADIEQEITIWRKEHS